MNNVCTMYVNVNNISRVEWFIRYIIVNINIVNVKYSYIIKLTIIIIIVQLLIDILKIIRRKRKSRN